MITSLLLVCALIYVIAKLLIDHFQLPAPVRTAIVVTEIIFFLFVLLHLYGLNIIPVPVR